MNIFEKEFDFVIQRAKSLDRPPRMVVAGADCENILKAVFEAQNQGFCRPILVGSEEKISAMLKKLGLYDLTPALCHLDYTMSDAGGASSFVREYTLASGGPYCDCGYKRKAGK